MNEQAQDFSDGVDTECMDTLGAKVYGEEWPKVRVFNIRRMKGDDPIPLGQEECNLLADGLRKLDEIIRRKHDEIIRR